jgi:hypothetical protein
VAINNDTDGRILNIEKKLQEHGRLISKLQESTQRLEEGQARQNEAMTELSINFGKVVRELGEVSKNFSDGKQEIMGVMKRIADNVNKLDGDLREFRATWKAVCDERHKHVDFRLAKAEGVGDQALREIDDMSEQSKITYIKDLQSKLDKEYKKNVRTSNHMWKFAIAIITGLLTGTGGTVILQWLLKG